MSQTHDARLEELPLLAAATAAVRARLLEASVVHGSPAGAALFDQGDAPTFQHLVLSGSVHLFGRSSEGREVMIETVDPPDLVVPAAVLTGAPYLVQARTLEPSRLLLIQAAAFRAAVEEDAGLARAAVASLAGQYRRMVRQIKNLKLRTSVERVGCYILALSRRQASDSVVLPYDKGLIASELGITRESFSRALQTLQQQAIAVKGERIDITDPARLAAVSRPDPLIDPDEAGAAG